MSATAHILKFIYTLPVGKMFATRDVLHFAARPAVDQALKRMVDEQSLIRLTSGVFLYNDPKLDQLPSIEEIAKVKAAAFGRSIFPSMADEARAVFEDAREFGSADAADILADIVRTSKERAFATDGSNSSLKILSVRVHLEHIAARKIAIPQTAAGRIIKALWYLKRDGCDARAVQAAFLSLVVSGYRTGRLEVKRLIRWMTAWLADRIISWEHLAPMHS